MREYTIVRRDMPLPDLFGMNFEPENEDFCEGIEYAPIDSYVWDATGYRPDARAYLSYDDEALHVLMCACEETVQAEVKEFNGPVYQDSCLEFFFKPFEDDDRYLNIEINPLGTALVGFGASRFDRKVLAEQPDEMNICASRHRGGWWAVGFDLPVEFIRDVYGKTPRPGDTMYGNFYKCDESIHPHFGSWAPIVNFRPDFHLPQWFGKLILAR